MVDGLDDCCLSCGGSGWIGGPSYYNPGEGGYACEDCEGTGQELTYVKVNPDGGASFTKDRAELQRKTVTPFESYSEYTDEVFHTLDGKQIRVPVLRMRAKFTNSHFEADQ